jgi:hypothetical protein
MAVQPLLSLAGPATWINARLATASDEAGFVSIFNGRDLTGWDGDPERPATHAPWSSFGQQVGQNSNSSLIPTVGPKMGIKSSNLRFAAPPAHAQLSLRRHPGMRIECNLSSAGHASITGRDFMNLCHAVPARVRASRGIWAPRYRGRFWSTDS